MKILRNTFAIASGKDIGTSKNITAENNILAHKINRKKKSHPRQLSLEILQSKTSTHIMKFIEH